MKFSRTPSSISLTLVGRVAADGRAAPSLDELLDLLVAAVVLPPQRPDDARGQLAADGERDVGELLLVAVDDRVLPGGDAERVEVALGEP